MNKIIGEGLTFDDVMLMPGNNFNGDVNLKTKLTKKINMNTPIISAPMDTVTESQMAIAIARQGGVGIIHNKMSIEQQASEVDKVKRSEHGVITDPFSLSPNHYVYEANDLMGKFHISGVPVTENGFLVGIITNRDLKFEVDHSKKIYEVMTRDNLVTAKVGTTLDEAKKILLKYKIEKLPLVDNEGMLKGLITIKDIDKIIKYPNSAKDEFNRLICGAKVDINDEMYNRIDALIEVKVDVILVSKNNGHDKELIDAIKSIKEKYPTLEVIAGDVVTEEAALGLINAGADGLIVGFGSGNVSTSRVITGVGVPQITSILNIREICDNHNVPIISKGGIKYSGDIAKAIGAGASSVMIGEMLAGCNESPGDIELYQGRKYKVCRGYEALEIISTKKPSKFQKKVVEKQISESVEGRVSYTGSTQETIYQLLGGLKMGMKYTGNSTIESLRLNGSFMKVTEAGRRESHPYNVFVTKEAANYSIEV